MAGVRQLGWKAIPAVRSGYGADTLPDRYRSDGSADQPVQQCSTLAAVIAAKEHKVFLFRGQTARSALSPALLSASRQTVITVITEGIPLIQYIAERFAQSGFFRQRTILLHHPFMQRRQ